MNAEPFIPYVIAAGSVITAAAGDAISVDPGTVMGGGGLTMGGILLHALWRYLKRQEKLQDLQEELSKAQLKTLDEERRHRESERSHWRMVDDRLQRQGETLRDIDAALRPPTGPHTPVHGIDLRETEPGAPESPGAYGPRVPRRTR